MKYQINPLFIDHEDLLLSIESVFEHSDTVLQDARNKIKKVSYKDVDFVVKSFKKPNLLNRILYSCFRDSKARRSYDYSIKIAEFVPQAIGYVEFYDQNLISNSYYISEMFDYDFTIREILLDEAFPEREIIFKAFAKFSFQLHQQEILHRDYSPGNILIKKEGTGYLFKIIDVNRMDFAPLQLEQRMRAFYMLWANDQDLDLISKEYALLGDYDLDECQRLAKYYNHKNKRFKNFKKKLKGIPVTD